MLFIKQKYLVCLDAVALKMMFNKVYKSLRTQKITRVLVITTMDSGGLNSTIKISRLQMKY